MKNQERKWNLMALVVALLVPQLAGGLGAIATNQSVSSWYPRLNKPAWTPPSWVFGPVWTLLYALMGLASWLVWREGQKNEQETQMALQWYGLQLGFNTAWSIIFFGFRRIGLALIDIVTLAGTLLMTLIQFSRVRHLAGWLLVPYALWVAFAAALNTAIWRMNRDE